jgi:hypothetical protein
MGAYFFTMGECILGFGQMWYTCTYNITGWAVFELDRAVSIVCGLGMCETTLG